MKTAALEEHISKRVLHVGREPEPVYDCQREESLAAVFDGLAAPQERDGLLEHLAECPRCRTTFSLMYLSAKPVVYRDTAEEYGMCWSVLAVAAMIMIIVLGGVSLVVFMPLGGSPVDLALVDHLIEQRQFDAALRELRPGSPSPARTTRLAACKLQVASPELLHGHGRLTDFGVTLEGAVARAGNSDRAAIAESAARALVWSQHLEPEEVTNHATLWLISGRSSEALKVLEAVRGRETAEDWLAIGIARFLEHDYELAETAFRQSLEEDLSGHALLNLAMTLTELGRYEEAIKVWRQVPPATADPRLVGERILELESYR